jgi:hypothetical protein
MQQGAAVLADRAQCLLARWASHDALAPLLQLSNVR